MTRAVDESERYVYVATGEHGSKIGIAADPEKRMGQIGGTLVASWLRQRDARRVELLAHKIVGLPPTSGREWFDIDREMACLTVRNAIALVDRHKPKSATGVALSPRRSEGSRVFGFTMLRSGSVYEAVDAMRRAGIADDDLYVCTSDATRAGTLTLVLKALRSGDTFVTHRAADLGDCARDVRKFVGDLTARGVEFACA